MFIFRSCKDEIVITGLSGRLPESDSIDEFRENLMNHVDMISEDNRRWTPGKPDCQIAFCFVTCQGIYLPCDCCDTPNYQSCIHFLISMTCSGAWMRLCKKTWMIFYSDQYRLLACSNDLALAPHSILWPHTMTYMYLIAY